jgi:phage repressor protein C with HTH and peptisase S24 domain
MTPYEKIKEARTQLSLNQADFADALGVSQNEVSKLEKGGKKFIPNSYISFLSEKGYDLNTLFDDNQPLKKLQQDHNILQEPKARYLQRTDVMQKNQMIPLFNIEAAAGLVELFQHVDEKTPIDFLSIPNLPKCDGAVFVTGDSMYPLLKSGDIVIYKQVYNIEEGIFYGEMYLISLAMDDEEYISVKYIQKSDLGDDYIKLVSQNGHHQPKDIHKNRIRALAMVKAIVRINAMR